MEVRRWPIRPAILGCSTLEQDVWSYRLTMNRQRVRLEAKAVVDICDEVFQHARRAPDLLEAFVLGCRERPALQPS
jgi:hypothetical protein